MTSWSVAPRHRWVKPVAALLTVTALWLGSSSGPARGDSAFSPGVVAMAAPCPSGCFEPTVAVDHLGRVFVAVGYDTAASPGGGRLAVSTDGGRRFSYRPTPPNPAPGGTFVGDATVAVSTTGQLYYYAVVGAGNGTPAPLWFYGVEVAYSDDGARTWRSNVLVSVLDSHPAAVALPDRPWLAFGPNHTVWLSYNQQDSSELVLRSDDDGRSFRQVSAVTTTAQRGTWGQAGPVVYDPGSGRLYLPYLTQAEPARAGSGRLSAVRLAVSADGGRSFSSYDVYRPSSAPAGEGFPILGVTRSGRLWAAWSTYPDSVTMVATSADRGRTWSTPARWVPPEPSPSPTVTCPWISPVGDAVETMAYHYDGKVIDAWLGSAQASPAGRRPTWAELARHVEVIPGSANGGSACNTDFANFAVGPDGCAVAVWADPRTGVMLRRRSPAPGRRVCAPSGTRPGRSPLP